jgi:ABC-type uncharacterized transport system permease subunit
MDELGMSFWGATLAGAIRAGTPLLFAAVGEVIYERSGVLNISIEGMMLTGALASVAAQVILGSWPLSIVAALLAGAAFGLLHGLACTVFRANQVAAGLALVTLAQGATALLGRNFVGRRVVAGIPSPLASLESVPLLGPALCRQDVLTFAALLSALGAWFFLFRTRFGVELRAVGEDARAAEARGLPVIRIRMVAAAVAGALSGLGGAHLALAYASQWQEGMVAGRGWIALVLVICSLWRPRVLIAAAYLFGGLAALQLNLQAAGLTVSPHLLGMLPFLASILVLLAADLWMKGRPLGMPADLGKPYEPLV